MKTKRFPSLRDESGVCSLRPSAAVLRKFLVMFFFVCVSSPVSFFLLCPPFVPRSFFWGLLPSWTPLRRGDSWSASLSPRPPNVNVKAFWFSLPPWPSSVCSLFCVHLVSCCTHAVAALVRTILVCVCTLGAVGMDNSSRCSTIPVGRSHTLYLFLTDLSVLESLCFPTLFLTVPSCLCFITATVVLALLTLLRDAVPVTRFFFICRMWHWDVHLVVGKRLLSKRWAVWIEDRLTRLFSSSLCPLFQLVEPRAAPILPRLRKQVACCWL